MTLDTNTTFPLEGSMAVARARAYVWVRLAVDIILLALALLTRPGDGRIAVHWLLLADLIGLAIYWFAVARWPAASTYVQLVFAALLIMAFDVAYGALTLYAWLLLIPLSLAGGVIIGRAGFNSLVVITIIGLWGLFLGLAYVGRLSVQAPIATTLWAGLAVSVIITLFVINALVEVLIVSSYQTQENLVQARVQLLNTLSQLEFSQREFSEVQQQAFRTERLTALGQLSHQIGRTLQAPLARIQDVLVLPATEIAQPSQIEAMRKDLDIAVRVTDSLRHLGDLGRLNEQPVDMDDLIASEMNHLQAPSIVRLELRLPVVAPPLTADPDHMRLLIHHLLSNAVSAMPDGGTITIELTPRPNGIHLTVADTGRGIAPDQLPHIFEPLYTTDATRFGLGLAICQQIVDLHGGRIKAESTVGKGSTFTVYLPTMPRLPVEELALDLAG